MSDKGKHPIIANGQYYVDPLIKKTFGGEIKFPHEYEEAKVRLSEDISKIQNSIENSDEVFANEKVLCIRLEPSLKLNLINRLLLLRRLE